MFFNIEIKNTLLYLQSDNDSGRAPIYLLVVFALNGDIKYISFL